VLPPADVREVLQGIAVLRPGRGWQLRLDEDSDFVQQCARWRGDGEGEQSNDGGRYPEVAAAHDRLWDDLGAEYALPSLCPFP
jgi:hypothetical protein